MLTLTTDFGTTEYVAQMKGVIYRIYAEARITDVSHEILPQNVLQGAYVLATSASYFPQGTVHIGVVDPGVGTDRRAIAIQCKEAWLVGPDNGLLWPAAQKLGPIETRELSNAKYFRDRVSQTFHGRDMFAPVAAHLAASGGDVFEDLGRVVKEPITLELDEGAGASETGWHGVVIHVDRFGNVVTNLPRAAVEGFALGDVADVRFDGAKRRTVRRVRTYAEAGPDDVVALTASSGFLEFAMNEEAAAPRLGVRPGDAVDIRRA